MQLQAVVLGQGVRPDGQRSRPTAFFPTPVEARNARDDLLRDVRNGLLPANDSMRVKAASSRSCEQRAGCRLNKHGRRYKALGGSRSRRRTGEPRGGGIRREKARRRPSPRRAVPGRRDGADPVRKQCADRSSMPCTRLYRWAQARELVSTIQPRWCNSRPWTQPRDRVATPDRDGEALGCAEPRDAVPFALAAYATARRAEIRHLRVEDVDLKLGVIYLGADERGRKCRPRSVPSDREAAMAVLRRHLLESGRPDARVCSARASNAADATAACFRSRRFRCGLMTPGIPRMRTVGPREEDRRENHRA